MQKQILTMEQGTAELRSEKLQHSVFLVRYSAVQAGLGNLMRVQTTLLRFLKKTKMGNQESLTVMVVV